jgi:D-glycero-D-manno-heptose 1,7-bisphosphate phosphatase
MVAMLKPGVFIDRDGVINVNRSDYVKRWDEFTFEEDALSSLKALAGSHFSIVIVSNQSAIGRGLMDVETVEEIHERMLNEIARNGGRVDAVYYCPHTPSDRCDCRKPKPGLLLKAARELDIDLARSFFIGDAISDVEAALAAGCTPLFVQTGLGGEQLARLKENGHAQVQIFQGLREVTNYILEVDKKSVEEGLSL